MSCLVVHLANLQAALCSRHHSDTSVMTFMENSESLTLQALAELIRSGTDDVRISALETVGNLSFQVENRVIFLADADLLEWIYRLARDQVLLQLVIAADHLLNWR